MNTKNYDLSVISSTEHNQLLHGTLNNTHTPLETGQRRHYIFYVTVI